MKISGLTHAFPKAFRPPTAAVCCALRSSLTKTRHVIQPAFCSPRENRPPNPRSKTTVCVLIRENIGERESTAFPGKRLRLLWIPNDSEQGRTTYWRKGWDSNP